MQQHQLRYSISWHHSGQPFLSKRGELAKQLSAAIHATTGVTPTFSTHGGTSDGRFIAPLGAQIVEFGPCGQTAHQIDECIALENLVALAQVYQRLLAQLFDHIPRAAIV